MFRLSYILIQGFFLFAIHDEFILCNGGIHRAVAEIEVKFTCQGGVMNLHCQSPKAIKIVSAYTGEKNNICKLRNSAMYCAPVDKMSYVKKRCEGKMTCNISVNKTTMGDKCLTAFKYLEVMYECKIFPPTTEPPYVQNKSTMVLTSPSTLHQPLNVSTGNPTTGIEKEEESTSVVYGFVLYNGESVYTVSSVLAALVLALGIFI